MNSICATNRQKRKHSLFFPIILLSLLFACCHVTPVKAGGVSSIKVVVGEYETTQKAYTGANYNSRESIVDHIILKYSGNVQLPKSSKERKKLYTFTDTWFGGTRKVANVYTNNKPQTTPNGKSKKGKYVIVQFEKLKKLGPNRLKKKQLAGKAIVWDNANQIYLKRTNWDKVIFTQTKAIKSTGGKVLKKAGRIPLKTSYLEIDAPKPVKLDGQEVSTTISVPDLYTKRCEKNAGKLETVTYNTKDYYYKDGKTYQKTAYVYLPYGYEKNTNKKYTILYYVHGTGQNASSTAQRLRHLFDNMIANKMIEPMIVVFPTFYTNNTPDRSDFAERGFRNGDAFDQEFKYDLMKAVEGKYRTYAKSTSDADLIASRDHRIITGLSAGGIITWQVLIEDGEYVKYYIPMSGTICNMFDENDVSYSFERRMSMTLEKARALKKNGMDYQIIECCGTQDIKTDTHANNFAPLVKEQFASLSKETELFGKKNYHVIWIKGATHENKAWDDGLYNALPHFFPGTK